MKNLRICLSILILLLHSEFLQAEKLKLWPTQNTQNTRSTMLAIGSHNGLDTYLSPQEYKGIEMRLLRENLRMTHLMKDHVSVQNLFQVQLDYGKTDADKAKDIGGMVSWDIAWHYYWQIKPNLRLMAGPTIQTRCGFIYNTRNGNNPAQARLAADIGLSGMALWKVQIPRKTLTLRAQIDLPVLGACFSPNYGQSYYEIFTLGHYDHNVCFTNTFQALSFRTILTVDTPFKWGTLRIGYLCDIRQGRINNLKNHSWSNAFLIGYVKHFNLFKP